MSEGTVVEEQEPVEGMVSIHQWKKLHEENEPATNNETGPPAPQQEQPDEQWQYLKQMFGQDRMMADASLVNRLESQPMGTILTGLMQKFQGNKDEAAKELITAVLKVIFGDEAGAGKAVAGRELAASSDAPLGNAASAPSQHTAA